MELTDASSDDFVMTETDANLILTTFLLFKFKSPDHCARDSTWIYKYDDKY